LALVWVSFWEIRKFRHDGGGFDRLVRYFFLFGYFGLILGAIPFHRNLFGDNGFGLGSVIAVITTVKMSDAAAYFFGKSLGRHKLAPQISSGKTVEGAVGAFVGGILGAAIVFRWVMPWLQAGDRVQSWQWIVLYGCALTLAGMLGDLVESLVKRDAHCKDSSGWLPGLGGILDVVDSLIFAAPASVIVWCCCPQW
jgi:phosphatidate cytidylyltransferase